MNFYEARCAVCEAIKSNSENGGGGGNEQKGFVDIRLRHVKEILKFQNMHFQLCYRSSRTIPSNGK